MKMLIFKKEGIRRIGENMELECLQEEPKLILTYPHKSNFNRIGCISMVVLSFIVIWIMKYLTRYHTDFSDKMIMAIVLIVAPLLVWFIGYYLFINGVKLEICENEVVQYYTYGSRGRSVLHFKFKLEDIEQIKTKKRPFHCLKMTIKIRNPIFYGLHEKKLNKLKNVSIILDRKKSDCFMQQIEQFHRKSIND
jgi:yihY family protein